jgi:hypothetical protein
VNLAGAWIIDDTDQRVLADLGNVEFEFKEDGGLTYTIHAEGKDQIIELRYQIDGATIVTDQPSAPRVERTAFSLSEDGALTLVFGGKPYRFKRP